MRDLKRQARFACLVGFFGLLFHSVPATGQQADSVGIRVYVFAADESSDDPVPVDFSTAPAAGPNHGWNGLFQFDAKRGRDQGEALRHQLERTSNLRRLIHVVNAQEDADLFLEIVATDYSDPRNPRMQRDLVVVRLSGHQTATVDFLGQRTDALRPETYGAAMQIEGWIEANYKVLQEMIAGSPS